MEYLKKIVQLNLMHLLSLCINPLVLKLHYNEVLKQGDLCITRAGASSLAELSFLNIPFIAIPLPSSKDDHQYENAKYYEEQDCCWIIDQKNFDDQKFEKFLLELTNKSQDYMTKKNNLQKLNYQNTWNNVNQKILKIINEN